MNESGTHRHGPPPSQGDRLVSTIDLQISRRPSMQVARDLLEGADLPTADLTPEKLETFFIGEREGVAVGIVGLELYAHVALLRSLAVTANDRSRGVGSELVKFAQAFAASKGVKELYLLTATAPDFFVHHEYRPVSRQVVPPEIRLTCEFSTICPLSSTVMKKGLRPAPVLPI